VLTIERSVWLGAAGGTVAALLATRATRRWLIPALVGGAVVVGVALLVIPQAYTKVTKQAANQYSIWDRENLANTAYNMIEARPLFGFGWQTYNEKHLPYEQQLTSIPLTATTAGLHNILLSYAVDLGLIGAALWTLGIVLGVGGALATRAPPDLQPWRLTLLALFVFFIIQENSVPPTVFQNQVLWLWAGLVWAARYQSGLRGPVPRAT
jgi:O-antigen ligase